MGGTPVPYDLLAIFAAVAEESSFSRAAHKLGVGKSTVSRSIARLEEQLGAALIHRSTHKVALSTAGTALYERVAPHLAALGQAVGKLPESAAEPSGELRMTVPHDFGAIVLPALLAQFSLRHPEVSFDVRVTNRQIDLVSEGIDLAIRASPQRLKDSSLTARRLGDVLMACYAAPSYLARRGEPRSFGDPKHEWAVFPPLLALAQVPKEFRPRVRADDFLLLRALLAEGAGVGALPVFVAAPYVAEGALQQVLPKELFRGPGGYYLLFPTSAQRSRKVTAFRDFALERLKLRPLSAP
ncbi:LysR family transcriptional regulator [Haliangium ochraceum]|uniref:Transcriptional regulator, LysR family n=1 Tax=Haliangium ochraceum (strain DSM 14365 / JCM 11303 / SMP-2) TaxID=502025 RepID=D0LTU8_HALO1|nr:LysR family transcriptional regulator [Haliangium ochraceum]ACY15792.1 transcriptional regulator, LysR family [Haliangium ochraceum DSM 14365]